MYRSTLTFLFLMLFLSNYHLKAQYVFKEFDLNAGAGNSWPNPDMKDINGKLYFHADNGTAGREPFISDGTVAGTFMLKDINPGILTSIPPSVTFSSFTAFNGKAYFSATDGANGAEVWVTDGTTAGTQLAFDINPGAGSSNAKNYTVWNSKMYFMANDGISGDELWVTDGTVSGTQMLKDINPGVLNGSPQNFCGLGSKLIFQAQTATEGMELWVTDGTASGTQLLKDIYSGITGSVGASSKPVAFNGKLYFTAETNVEGMEPWVTDGTAAGTQLLKDITAGAMGSSCEGYYVCNGKLFFAALAGGGPMDKELWATDGTTAGTQLVKDINPGAGFSSPSHFMEYNSKLYFTAQDATNDKELWLSDGTAAGTVRVKNIHPTISSSPWQKTVYKNKMYFIAYELIASPTASQTIFVSNGVDTGTKSIAPPSATPGNAVFSNTQFAPVVSGNNLFFYANYNGDGYELWCLTDTTTPIPPGSVHTVNNTATFSIAPNPTKDAVTITLQQLHTGAQLSLVDLTGKEVYRQQLKQLNNSINVSALPKGTYIVLLKYDTGKEAQQLVLE